jgi:cytochrome c biogenesis protein CcdA
MKESILSAMLLRRCSNFTAQMLARTSDSVEIARGVLILAVGVLLCVLQAGRKEGRERAPD